MMKIIITGATGFLGRNLAERFHEDGLQVVATGRSPDAGGELRKKGIEFQRADIWQNQ
jgi:nucleoside-diphosphate-sugar epimerase